MPENPLLPHRRLREMLSLMLRCRTLLRGGLGLPLEAILAATTMHLQPGDLLCKTSADPEGLFAELAPPSRGGVVSGGLAVVATPGNPLPMAAAFARGLLNDEQENKQAVALVFAQSSKRSPGWKASFSWAQEQTLPLIVVVTESSAKTSRAARSVDTPSWDALSRHARALQMPVVTVDGEDAVALYRVMQETVIRARHGGGPAVIWGVLGCTAKDSKPANPVARLRRYMKVRNITLS